MGPLCTPLDLLGDKTLNVNFTYSPSGLSTAVSFGAYFTTTYDSANSVTGIGHVGGTYNRLNKQGVGTLNWGMASEVRIDANAGDITLATPLVLTLGRSNEVTGTMTDVALAYFADISDDGSGTGDNHISGLKYSLLNVWANGLMYTAGSFTAIGTVTAGHVAATTATVTGLTKTTGGLITGGLIGPAGDVTLDDSMSGKELFFLTGSTQTVTDPGTLTVGFECWINQADANQITITHADNASYIKNVSGHTKTGGTNALVKLRVSSAFSTNINGDTGA